MKKSRFANGGEAVQVGFLNADAAQTFSATGTTTEFTADTAVRIRAYSGDIWFAINAAPTAVAGAEGSVFLLDGDTETGVIKAGSKINATGAFNVMPFE